MNPPGYEFPEELAAFILARLDERQRAAEQTGDAEYGWNVGLSTSYGSVSHAELHTPSWVLRDVESKRRLVQAVREQLEQDDYAVWLAWQVLSLLVLSYADHPDYRPEWAPGKRTR